MSPDNLPTSESSNITPSEEAPIERAEVSSTRSQDATLRQEQLGSISASYSEHYQGAVAHPHHLAQFEQIVPGSAARMIDWVEDEADHRRSMERLESDREFELEKLRIQNEAEIQTQAIQAQNTAVTSENQVRVQVGCGAHATAGVALLIGLALGLQGHSKESIAVFGVLGAIYGGGIIVTALSGGTPRRRTPPSKNSSSD